MKQYDYVIVGAGVYGSTCARELTDLGYSCLVMDKRHHIGGNCYTENVLGIHVHKYGAHIFHTSNERVWKYVQRFARFNNFVNRVQAYSRGRFYSLPFNLATFEQVFHTSDRNEIEEIIKNETAPYQHLTATNLEERALQLIGPSLYELLVKGYSEKQWGRSAREIPAFIIDRLPIRWTKDDNYYNHKYQGIPIGGYTAMFDKMLAGVDVELNVDFLPNREYFTGKVKRKLIYTGKVDEFFDYCYGDLEYRSLSFEHKFFDTESYQPSAVVNYTARGVPYTRTIDHKKFESDFVHPFSVVSFEYPKDYSRGGEAYYAINSPCNNEMYQKYKALAKDENCAFGGRLGSYKYLNMHEVFENALNDIPSLL